jgi:hypothetical protein
MQGAGADSTALAASSSNRIPGFQLGQQVLIFTSGLSCTGLLKAYLKMKWTSNSTVDVFGVQRRATSTWEAKLNRGSFFRCCNVAAAFDKKEKTPSPTLLQRPKVRNSFLTSRYKEITNSTESTRNSRS